MAYRIVYGPEIKAPKQTRRTSVRIPAFTAAFLLAFVLLVRQFWPAGTEILKQYLLPGEPTVTEQAFSAMVENIRAGEGIGEAFAVFCEEIIHDDQSPD